MERDLSRKGIRELVAYIPGKAIEEVTNDEGVKRWRKLASNENLRGPSRKAVEAIKGELGRIHLYPEGPCSLLKEALARHTRLPGESTVVSNGADNLILMIAEAFLNEGEEVILAHPTFPVYETAAKIMGGIVRKVALKDFRHDLPAMGELAGEKTKLIFICNPNNPTGTIVRKDELERFLADLPPGVIVVLDEAYGEFVEDGQYPQGADYVREGRNIIVLRTFSKVYGLAGLRIGYALGNPELIDCLNRVREPFPVGRLAQAAAAAALADRDHAEKSIKTVAAGRKYLYWELARLGFPFVRSQANFILIDFRRDGDDLTKALLKEGIIIRPGGMWGYPTCGRVTVGRRDDNRQFIRALEKIKGPDTKG